MAKANLVSRGHNASTTTWERYAAAVCIRRERTSRTADTPREPVRQNRAGRPATGRRSGRSCAAECCRACVGPSSSCWPRHGHAGTARAGSRPVATPTRNRPATGTSRHSTARPPGPEPHDSAPETFTRPRHAASFPDHQSQGSNPAGRQRLAHPWLSYGHSNRSEPMLLRIRAYASMFVLPCRAGCCRPSSRAWR